jgi:hypothetical protein
MAVILENSAILHIPKTAGKYVRSVLDNSGISYYQTPNQPCGGVQQLINRGHSSHCIPYGDEEYQKRSGRRACFIRHPLTWYQSYWAYRVQHGQRGGNPYLSWRIDDGGDGAGGCLLDMATACNNFPRWIDNVIARFPDGLLTYAYNVYIEECNFVGQMETLDNDLAKFIWMYEGKVTVPGNRGVNVGDPLVKSMAKYRPGQPEQIMRLEAEIIDKYNYGWIPKGLYE